MGRTCFESLPYACYRALKRTVPTVSAYMEKITPQVVRELIHYDARTGSMAWKPRSRKWFGSDTDWKRWNNRYAGQPAFTYVHGGKRWGCIFNQNHLAHRVAWLYVHGAWPHAVTFKNGDATDLRLSNMIDRGAPHSITRVRMAA